MYFLSDKFEIFRRDPNFKEVDPDGTSSTILLLRSLNILPCRDTNNNFRFLLITAKCPCQATSIRNMQQVLQT
jgi:hypothetical protein